MNKSYPFCIQIRSSYSLRCNQGFTKWENHVILLNHFKHLLAFIHVNNMVVFMFVCNSSFLFQTYRPKIVTKCSLKFILEFFLFVRNFWYIRILIHLYVSEFSVAFISMNKNVLIFKGQLKLTSRCSILSLLWRLCGIGLFFLCSKTNCCLFFYVFPLSILYYIMTTSYCSDVLVLIDNLRSIDKKQA